jgi:predicted metalloprotease
MKWFGGRESDDVEEGSSGGGRGFLFGGGILGLIGFLIYIFTGVNPAQLFNQGGQSDAAQQNSQPVSGPESEAKHFSRVVFEGTSVVWDSLFTAMGKTYKHPILHFYTGQVNAACGFATAHPAPFIVRLTSAYTST